MLNLHLNHALLIRLTNIAPTAAPTVNPTAAPTLAPKCLVPGPANFPAPVGGRFDSLCENFATPRAGTVCQSTCNAGYRANGTKPTCVEVAAVAGSTTKTAVFLPGDFVCIPNECTCPNGSPHALPQGRCHTHGLAHCHQCDEHYHLNTSSISGPSACVANPTCTIGKLTTDDNNEQLPGIPWDNCTHDSSMHHPHGTLKANQKDVICRGSECNWKDCCEVKTCGGNAARESIVANPVCDFPFMYQNVRYHECTDVHNDGKTWCYVKGHNTVPFGATGEAAIRRWGNCKACVASTNHAAGTLLATGLTALAVAVVAALN